MATINPPAEQDEAEIFEAIVPPKPRMTEKEFVTWCNEHEKIRAEWVGGEVIVMSPANLDHVNLVDFLTVIMRVFVEHHDLGRVFAQEYTGRFRARSRNVRRMPDIQFVANPRLKLLKRTYLDGPPDLAVEIVSPDSKARDWREKFLDYQAAGVCEYLLINPLAKVMEASRLRKKALVAIPELEGRLQSAVLPGFFLRPAWLWSEPLPRVRDVFRELGV
jgi:Uma2 family endonuclease